MDILISILGLVCFLLLAFALSEHRSKIDFKLVGSGLLLQLILAILVLGVPKDGFNGPLRFLFKGANTLFTSLLNFTRAGSKFLFGPFIDNDSLGVVVALEILPTIIFFSSLIAILYYLGIIQVLTKSFAKLMLKLMKVSGAESLSAAANIFVGQTEAPLLIRPYVSSMTRSELFSVMVGGMATVAGSVFAIYVQLLEKTIPDIAGHLLTASVISAPAALVMAKIILPETLTPKTLGKLPEDLSKSKDSNMIEAAARGAGEGLTLALNVGAMLLAFIALIALANKGVESICTLLNYILNGSFVVPVINLTDIFGFIFAPLAWVMGIPWNEAAIAGQLLGEKVVLNEFVAYLHLSEIANTLSQRTVIILSYALCGFANFSSIAIQIGGIGGMAPERKSDLAQLGIRAVIGGSLAAFMTACLAGILL